MNYFILALYAVNLLPRLFEIDECLEPEVLQSYSNEKETSTMN